jgi:hypothetical protein
MEGLVEGSVTRDVLTFESRRGHCEELRRLKGVEIEQKGSISKGKTTAHQLNGRYQEEKGKSR